MEPGEKGGGILPPRSGAPVPNSPVSSENISPSPRQGPQDIAAILRSLNIPLDSLSLRLAHLLPFFALSWDGDLLRELRRELLSLESRKTPTEGAPGKAQGGEEKNKNFDIAKEVIDRDNSGQEQEAWREGAALGAMASRAKGLRMSREALEAFAREGAEGQRAGQAPWEGQEDGEEAPRIGELLNRIRDRDGKRREIYPFRYGPYRVTALLRRGPPPEEKVEELSLEIRGGRTRWNIRLINWEEGGRKTLISRDPPLAPSRKGHLEGELRSLLGEGAGRIVFEENSTLPSINEEV